MARGVPKRKRILSDRESRTKLYTDWPFPCWPQPVGCQLEKVLLDAADTAAKGERVMNERNFWLDQFFDAVKILIGFMLGIIYLKIIRGE